MASWQPDVLTGYESLTIDLPDAPAATGESDQPLVATLVRRIGQPREVTRAVLYVHGWNDYFFQTELADQFLDADIDFYAVDLRRYGRSLRPGQYVGYVDSLSDYADEISLAIDELRADYPSVAIMGHSTGGLIAALWAAHHPGLVDAVLLNSPWLDLAGCGAVRSAVRPVAAAWSKLSPTAEIPMPSDAGFYAHMTHASLGGEWDYNLLWKSPVAIPVLAGWIRAVLAGQAAVSDGLGITVPTLVCCSASSDFSKTWTPELRRSDVVLDADMIADRAVRLGSCVTVERIAGGMHDLALSDEDARQAYYAAMQRWISAYWPTPWAVPAI